MRWGPELQPLSLLHWTGLHGTHVPWQPVCGPPDRSKSEAQPCAGDRHPVGTGASTLCTAVTLGVGFLFCWLESCCQIMSPKPHSMHEETEAGRARCVLHTGWSRAGRAVRAASSRAQ